MTPQANQPQPAPEDPVLCVSMPKSLWEALLTAEPFTKETYTDEGIAVFNAFQQVHQQTGIEGNAPVNRGGT